MANPFGSSSQILSGVSDLNRQYSLSNKGKNNNNVMLRRISTYNFGPAASRASFNAGQESNYQNTLTQLLNGLQNRNYALQGSRAAQRTMSQYGRAANLANQQARAAGLGQGSAAGGAGGLAASAARDASAAEASYLDPARRQGDLTQALSLLTQALSSNPYLDQISTAQQPLEQHMQSQRNKPGGLLNQVLGAGLSQIPWARWLTPSSGAGVPMYSMPEGPVYNDTLSSIVSGLGQPWRWNSGS